MGTAQARQSYTADLASEEERVGQAKLMMRLFELWRLDTSTQLQLLGLSSTSRALLSRYRKDTALPATRDVQDRVGWLLAIHKALGLLYPLNDSLRYGWVKQRNQAFTSHTTPAETLTPLEYMLADGLIGLAKVARYLDWQRGR